MRSPGAFIFLGGGSLPLLPARIDPDLISCDSLTQAMDPAGAVFLLQRDDLAGTLLSVSSLLFIGFA